MIHQHPRLSATQNYAFLKWFEDHSKKIAQNQWTTSEVAQRATQDLGFPIDGKQVYKRVGPQEGCAMKWDWNYGRHIRTNVSRQSKATPPSPDDISILIKQTADLLAEWDIDPLPEFVALTNRYVHPSPYGDSQ